MLELSSARPPVQLHLHRRYPPHRRIRDILPAPSRLLHVAFPRHDASCGTPPHRQSLPLRQLSKRFSAHRSSGYGPRILPSLNLWPPTLFGSSIPLSVFKASVIHEIDLPLIDTPLACDVLCAFSPAYKSRAPKSPPFFSDEGEEQAGEASISRCTSTAKRRRHSNRGKGLMEK